jgi:hypothetical protein
MSCPAHRPNGLQTGHFAAAPAAEVGEHVVEAVEFVGGQGSVDGGQ